MIFRRKKDVDPLELRFQMMVDLIKDLPRADYNRLKKAMDKVYDGWQDIRNVRTEEEKEIAKEEKANKDIVIAEKILEKEGK